MEQQSHMPSGRHCKPWTAWRSLALVGCACACFATLDTTAKRVTESLPLPIALWFLFLFQTLAYATLVVGSGRLALMRRAHWGAQLGRGALLLGVQTLAFLSLRYLPVGEFTAVAMLTPLLVTLLAGRMLGEHVSWYRIALVLGGFAGTLVIVRPGDAMLGWAIALPLALVAANAAYQLLTSWMGRTQDTWVTLLCTSAVCLVLLTPLLVLQGGGPGNGPSSSLPIWGLLLMGLAATSGNVLFVKAFESASANSLMPYMYLQIGFGILGGWWVFNHVPDTPSLLGMAMIAACGVVGGILSLWEAKTQTQTQTKV
jgi:drug/metabolite transporter (DMT)-like permease